MYSHFPKNVPLQQKCMIIIIIKFWKLCSNVVQFDYVWFGYDPGRLKIGLETNMCVNIN